MDSSSSFSRKSRAASSSSSSCKRPRVILLLDLDSFYAQCECRRLGWDAAVTPLALLQWNSVLAVTYPAREQFGVKRGDTWNDIENKAKEKQGHCHAIHVALLSMTTTTATPPSTSEPPEPPLTLREEYDRIFRPTIQEQETRRRTELGVRKHSTQGKACIERYRTASAVIFETVQEWISEQQQQHQHDDATGHSSAKIVLERASIDEFFLDVTQLVSSGESSLWQEEEQQQQQQQPEEMGGGGRVFSSHIESTQQVTVCVGKDERSSNNNSGENGDGGNNHDDNNNDDGDDIYYWRGAMIARWIRDRIRQRLGFTLSAGIASNKTLAKLTASYGKPNGQALTLPRHTNHLLQQTPIAKCRHLGGKLGKVVAALLPSDVEPTVGNIARYLSLPNLQNGLQQQQHQQQESTGSKFNESTAAFVYHLAHGRDDEAVAPLEGAQDGGLTKSITAFKSFPTGRTQGLTLAQAADWIRLLAQEVMGRIERDRIRNHRYPRTCNIQYSLPGWRSHQSRSVRITFPAQGLSVTDRVAELCHKVPTAVAQKEGKAQRLGRIGLCATDFIVRESGQQGLDAFCQSKSTHSQSQPPAATHQKRKESIGKSNGNLDVLPATQSQTADDFVVIRQNDIPSKARQSAPLKQAEESKEDADLALARKLQASYDRESQSWQRMDQSSRKRKQQQAPSTKKISSFFRKK